MWITCGVLWYIFFNSHSDGTHSLQRILWWTRDVIYPSLFCLRNKHIHILNALRVGLCDMTMYIGWTKYKVYRFILCSIVYFVVSQNILFMVILFHHLGDCDLYTPPRGVNGNQNQVENDQPGQNQELISKRGTTSVAWTRIYKHCSFKTTDFKLLKHKQQLNASAVSVSVWEVVFRVGFCSRIFFRFIGFERLHKHTYMCQNARKYPHKHDVGLKSE